MAVKDLVTSLRDNQKASDKLRDLWAEETADARSHKLAQLHDGYEADITPQLNRKRQYLRDRPEREVAKSKEFVTATGTKVAPAGASYNPDEEKRQEVLREAWAIDQKEKADLDEVHRKLNPTSSLIVVDKASSSDEEEGDEENELRPAKNNLVTQKTRRDRKVKRLKELERLKEQEQKKQNIQIDRLTAVVSSLKKEEKDSKKEIERVKALKETQPDRRPKVSKHEYQAPFPDVALEEELEDRSLRSMKPSVNLIRDQFKSFQEKNIIETRVLRKEKQMKRRYKMKQYTRNSHKEPNLTWNSKKPS